MDEYMLIKEYYGVEVIEFHIISLKQKKMEKSQFLRSLAQHSSIITESKQRLPVFYMIKSFLVSYWIVGENNFITLFVNGCKNLRNMLIYLVAGAEYMIKDTTACRGFECIKANSTEITIEEDDLIWNKTK
jgi:hypothetical protein